jgi:tryptophanyl-tRNA synthetase
MVRLPSQMAIPRTGRLPGIDGKAKMSKSQGNAIPLSAPPEAISEAVKRMYTDPGHLRAADPAKIEGNVVFTYLDAFDEDQAAVAALKEHYQRGGLGHAAVKRRLNDVLQALLAPKRLRPAEDAADERGSCFCEGLHMPPIAAASARLSNLSVPAICKSIHRGSKRAH